jgi:hypothetical protein
VIYLKIYLEQENQLICMDMNIEDATGNPATNIGARAASGVTAGSAVSALADVTADLAKAAKT